MKKALVVVSGGLDSTTLLYHVVGLVGSVDGVRAISFNYGQRHQKELHFAKNTCVRLGVAHTTVNLSMLSGLFADSGSSLVSDNEVPEGHYAEENMKQTVVPNRNMIMASIAAGYGISFGAEHVFMGVHSGDHFIYPDCRPAFFEELNMAIWIGNDGFGPIAPTDRAYDPYIKTPYIHWTKEEIAYRALELGVPLHMTWSCYKGGERHCGRCGTCVERLEAINSAIDRWNDNHEDDDGKIDFTHYEDSTFWRDVVGA